MTLEPPSRLQQLTSYCLDMFRNAALRLKAVFSLPLELKLTHSDRNPSRIEIEDSVEIDRSGVSVCWKHQCYVVGSGRRLDLLSDGQRRRMSVKSTDEHDVDGGCIIRSRHILSNQTPC